MKTTKVAFVGAGNIAETHAAALTRIDGPRLAAIVDSNAARAASFAKKWGAANVYDSVGALVAAGGIEAAHVLVPPPLHRPVAQPLLEAGIPVFLEKPMAESGADCAALQSAAMKHAALRINRNFIHHPAHLAARGLIAGNRIGKVRHVQLAFNLPLRQLQARQLGHWMFRSPLNLLLEQAVHPLSQIDDLVGAAGAVDARPMPPLRLGEGQEVIRTWLVSLECARGTAQLLVSLGESYPAWSATIIGDDGMIVADYVNNRVQHNELGPRMDLFDGAISGWRMGLGLQARALANLAGGAATMLKLRERSDPFYLSMKGSIEAFYRDLETSTGDLTGAGGRRMVELCERIAAGAAPRAAIAPPAPNPARYEILVIGGTGFIGQALVARLTSEGRRVGVLARNIDNLPSLYRDPAVSLVRGDARDRASVERAIGDASCVVNLAHGGGGGSRAEIEDNLVGSARIVAECCLARGVRRLIFVSSIAALYLGDPAEQITGSTPPDPEFEERADYGRAKVLAERALLNLHVARGLPVAILRPGVVIGDGGIEVHSGVGFFNHERHCLGWNRGLNPLPLVLSGDVADAIARAIDAPQLEGKCYNLVGDVRLSAREYIAELANVTGRPLRFHPQSVWKLYGIEWMKSLVKRVTGRRDPWPSLRDLKSRGLVAPFDCADAKRDLGWKPVENRAEFLALGFQVHARRD
jgi:predicted dehydrogenase/nucleoside-diphosphate-sugar epimerase